MSINKHNREMELLRSKTTRREERREGKNDGGWFSQMKSTLKGYGLWRNHEKEESLRCKAAEEDQTVREMSVDHSSLEGNTLLEKIEDVYENKINLRRVYGVKKGICGVRPRRGGTNDHVRKLQHLWDELQGLRTCADGNATLKQEMISRLVASMESSYGWLVEMVLKGEQLPEMERMCELVEKAHKGIRDRLSMSRSESSWTPTGSRSEGFQKLTMSRSEGSWRLTGSRSESFRKKRRSRMLAKGFSNMLRCRKRVVGECNYSAYMGEESVVTKKPGADEFVTKKEWDEFVKEVYALATTRRD